jgi:hypothetical protein
MRMVDGRGHNYAKYEIARLRHSSTLRGWTKVGWKPWEPKYERLRERHRNSPTSIDQHQAETQLPDARSL